MLFHKLWESSPEYILEIHFLRKMFESRIYFVDRLIGMGANAIVCDPHRVVISGPAKLHGSVVASPDIRAGMAMVIAGINCLPVPYSMPFKT